MIMPAAPGLDVRLVGERVQELVDELQASTTAGVADRAGEIVRLLMTLYGEGLRRIVDAAGPHSETLQMLADDDLVTGLLVLHGLHPVPVVRRIERALAALTPRLATFGAATLLGVEGDTARISFLGTGRSPGSAARTLRTAIENAVQAAAPEIADVEIQGLADPPPVPQPLPILRLSTDGTLTPVRP
jgi:Fe-S cluster biogenesis protein NfuA